jgi:transposase
MNFTMIFPGLKDVTVTKMEEANGIMRLHVEMERKAHRCPVCDRPTTKIHDYRIQKIKHLKWFERETVLFYRRRRYACECGKRFSENNPFVDRYQRQSIEFNQVITIKSIHGKTFKETAEIYGISSSTVVRRFDNAAKSEIRPIEVLPKAIAIDEYKGDTREGKYQLIIADAFTKEPIDILPNRKKKTIKRYLKRHGSGVQIVVMDMSPSFKAAVEEALDKPVIVADRFHFCRYIFWALDGVRRRVQCEFSDYDRKRCKRMRYVFHKPQKDLTDNEKWYLKRYLSFSDELTKAYELKEEYRTWFYRAKEIGIDNIKLVKEELLNFYHKVESMGIPELCKAIETFKNWQTEILNSFVYDYSNGFLEGINNTTKVLKRNAYGFRNFSRFRAKILLTHKYKGIGVHVG